jgi:hypothetical protein
VENPWSRPSSNRDISPFDEVIIALWPSSLCLDVSVRTEGRGPKCSSAANAPGEMSLFSNFDGWSRSHIEIDHELDLCKADVSLCCCSLAKLTKHGCPSHRFSKLIELRGIARWIDTVLIVLPLYSAEQVMPILANCAVCDMLIFLISGVAVGDEKDKEM